MGMGFRLSLKWDFPIHHHHHHQFLGNNNISSSRISSSSSSSSSSPSSSSPCCGRGRDTYFNSTRLSTPSNFVEEGDSLYKDPLRAYSCSSTSHPTLEYDTVELRKMKVSTRKRLYSSHNNRDGIYSGENKFAYAKGLQAVSASHFSLLMENLEALETTISAGVVLSLERDILMQLGRLGALKLFQRCLSKVVDGPLYETLDLSCFMIEHNDTDNKKQAENVSETVVRSGKGEARRMKRGESRKNARVTGHSLLSFSDRQPVISSPIRISNPKKRRLMIAKNEAEMSKGIKVIANLERTRTTLEEETGQVASLACWAEAAGLDERTLLKSLHFGWFCRDEILRNTRSLVLFLARNYRGLGIALEDLVQIIDTGKADGLSKCFRFPSTGKSWDSGTAGNMGVILGAERFDHTRGYRFSTYVQYWIRKSMSRMVTLHARGIRLPYTLTTAINQIQKARKSLNYQNEKYPDDEEIAKFTGLSMAKVKTASKCLRIVGSLDQKVGDCISAKYMELTSDLAIKSPEEIVMERHMRSEIHELLNGLDLREREVLTLRYGLRDHRHRSLEEIGRILQVSKEWIRKIERKALKKLRDPENCRSLGHYLNL